LLFLLHRLNNMYKRNENKANMCKKNENKNENKAKNKNP